MKKMLVGSLSFAIVISLMLQCTPVVGAMMMSALGQFEALAESIVGYDENGNVQLNGEGADELLDDLGEKSNQVIDAVGNISQEILNGAKDKADTPTS